MLRATCSLCGKSIQANTVGEEITAEQAMKWAAEHECVPPVPPQR